MGVARNRADAALSGDPEVLHELARSLLRVERDNFVERPWGGDWIRSFKRISPAAGAGSLPWGEAFEIAAYNDDLEAARFPSIVTFDDGSRADLPSLLEAQGEALLGGAFVERFGACFPLLPKTLDVKELLSVQGHPAGNTEVYVIIDAEPGATLRLGFNQDIDARALARDLQNGIEQQGVLLAMLGPDADAASVQATAAPWFARRGENAGSIALWIASAFGGRGPEATVLLDDLKALYWRTLDLMNEVEAEPGQVIYNATPRRMLSGPGAESSAEVHALGNPEGKEILALEIRRPGPTFRAWDNVRFPQRQVDVEAAIDSLNLRATTAEDFLCELRPVAGRDGAFVSVDCEHFRVEHLAPLPLRAVTVPASAPHSLHCLAGMATVSADDGRNLGRLEQGESALVPVGVGSYRVEASAEAEIVRVTLPDN